MSTTRWQMMKTLMTQKRTSEDYGMDDKAPATNPRPANNTPQSTTKPTPTNNQMNGSR